MKIDEVAGVGKIVKGVNTTPDVQPGETERQAKKYFGGTGKPKLLTADLSEKEETKDELKGFDPRTVKAINNLMIKFPQAKDPLSAIVADIEDSQEISIANDKHTKLRNVQQDKQIDDLTKRVDKLEKGNVTEDEDMDTIQRAEQFAQQAHKDHKRKYTGDPYYVHLDEVRRIVKSAGGSEDMQAAALLHDTVEDTATTSQDIMQEFGPAIAKLVVELTDISKPEDGNRATRKAMDRDKLAGVSADAQTIKYADLISNGRDIGVNDPKFAKVYHKEKADLLRVMRKGNQNLRNAAVDMLPDELRTIATENLSYTGTERRRLEKKKGIEVGTPEWFKHWFDLPYLREGDSITYDELVNKARSKYSLEYYLKGMMRTLHSLVTSGGNKHSIGYYAQEVGRQFGFSGRDLEKMYRKEYDTPETGLYKRFDEVNTTNPNTGVQTTIDKKANRVTTRSDAGTVVKDRSGNVRSMSTPKVGGFQATQTFRPDSTPGYQQATMKHNGMDLDVKGSPETGYTRTAKASIGGLGVGVKQRYDGSQQNTVDYTLGQGKKIGVTQNISKPKQKLTMSEGVQKVDVAQLEKFADRLFGKVGIDVEFTRHFMDRVNDVRNQKPITMSELTRLFKQEYKRWGKPIAQLGPDSEAVMKDLQTDINLPFVLKWDSKNKELDLIAKTVMRKADFKTPNKEFPVENLSERKYTINNKEIEELIRKYSVKHGIDPETAILVYRTEGMGDSYQSQIKPKKGSKVKTVNGQEASFGPYQLYTGGGLGNEYEKKYDVKLKNDNTAQGIERQIDFALNNAATSGKGWKPWYGPGNAYKDWNPMTGIPTKDKQKYVPPRTLTVPLAKPKTGTIQTGTTTGGPSKLRQRLAKQTVKPEVGMPLKAPGTFDFDQPDTTQPKPKISKLRQRMMQKNTQPKPEPIIRPKVKPADVQPITVSIPEPMPKLTTTYQDLAKNSGIKDPDKIFPGQNINFPDGSTYTVKSGDTLSGIASKYNKKIGESVPMPVTKKDAALQKQAQHMVMKSKIDQKPSVDMMQITNKGMRDHVKGIGQDADKLSKAAGIPRDAVKPPKPLTQRSGNFTKFSKNPFVEMSAKPDPKNPPKFKDDWEGWKAKKAWYRKNDFYHPILNQYGGPLPFSQDPDFNKAQDAKLGTIDPKTNKFYKDPRKVKGLYPDPQGVEQRANNIFYKAGRGLSRLLKQDPDWDPYDEREKERNIGNLPFGSTGPDAKPPQTRPPSTYKPADVDKVQAKIGAEFGLTGQQVQDYSRKDMPLPSKAPNALWINKDELPTDAQVNAFRKKYPPVFNFNENVPTTNKPGTIGQHINWAGKNKPQQTKKVATRGTQDPQNWWQSMLQKGKNLFDDEQLDLKKKFEITSELQQLNSIFKKGKHEIRIVGGAVRDLALGKNPKDIDLATDATPDEMQSMFDNAGVRHIPTGIEHGTITAVINGEEFEITTLRADVETDGRRAEVEFVRSWEEDAKRRDLTYNAMSIDFEGNLYDYHGGMDDLQDKVTRFVGDPEERIKEDYLRTLRYFRFQGRLDTPTFDRATMQAIANNTSGLKQLSVERVWMEMGKILSGSNIQQILSAMQKTGVLNAIGLNAKPSQELMDGGDPIINLARITDDRSIGLRWKMSNEEKGKLGFLISEKGKTHDKKWYTDQMADGFDRTQLDALARYNNQDDMIQYIKTFKAPEFPVDGNDLIKIGHERGPGIGKTLMALRNQWKQGNFTATKDELLKNITEGAEVTVWTNPEYQGADVDTDYYNKQPAKLIGIDKLVPFEPADKMDDKDSAANMAQFVKHIQAGGKINPIVITKHQGKWLILDGHHRYFASLKAGVDKMRVVIADPKDLTYRDDVPIEEDQEFNELDYVLKKEVKPGEVVIMTKLGKFHNGVDELEQFVPERKGKQYALHPDNWKGTYYSLTNKDTTKIGYYRPKIVTPPAGSMVADMAIANQFYRTNDEDEKQQLAQAYKDSMVEYGADISHIKFPEILMPGINENFADGKKKGKSRPGRVKRAGASCNGSVTSLRKKAKNASGEKAKMYHWCANMKSGKNKSK